MADPTPLKPKDDEFPCSEHTKILLDTLLEVYNSGAFSDFELRCCGETFKVHKIIISIHSPVLKAACTGPFKETEQNFLDMPSDDPSYVSAMVYAMYRGRYDDKNITYGADKPLAFNAGVYALADKYDVNLVKDAASKNIHEIMRCFERSSDTIQYPNSHQETVHFIEIIKPLVSLPNIHKDECLMKMTMRFIKKQFLRTSRSALFWDMIQSEAPSDVFQSSLNDMLSSLQDYTVYVCFYCEISITIPAGRKLPETFYCPVCGTSLDSE